MLKNRKGQALIEFVIILPVFIMLIFGFIDLGKIIYVKNELTNIIPTVESMHQNNNTYEEIVDFVKKNNNDNEVSISIKDNYITYEVHRYIDLVTPGIGMILESPYKVNASLIKEYE